MMIQDINTFDTSYRNIFLVADRNHWSTCPFPYDGQRDLVLSFDFGLVHMIDSEGGNASYLDHIVDSQTMEAYNHEMYCFFSKWHHDENGEDIFMYKGIKVGNAFRIEIWNDLTYYSRLYICLAKLKETEYQQMFVGVPDTMVSKILVKLMIEYKSWSSPSDENYSSYYFPIFQWNSEQLYPSTMKRKVKACIGIIGNFVMEIVKKINCSYDKPDVYIQNYHPTRPIIEALKKDEKVYLINETIGGFKGMFKHQLLPAWKTSSRHKHLAERMLLRFQEQKCEEWKIEGVDVSDDLCELFINRISDSLSFYLNFLDSIVRFFSKRNLKLATPISNIGSINCLVLNYCVTHNIPSYLIINGLLTSSYLDEGKDATWINGYGESIRKNYFKNMDNVVCLGDPRLDDYVNLGKRRVVMRDFPSILIGTAGFNNIDLNSYVAYEFSFMKDVIDACQISIRNGRKMNLIVKVRPNGYLKQYEAFFKEYYPNMDVVLYDHISFRKLVETSDLYISFYSQTLFEASGLGIPALYYKNDNEIFHPPFDGKCELVTAFSVNDLVKKIDLFYEHDPVYGPFMEMKVMEKYVGPLDGNNVERNLDFIYSLLFNSGERRQGKGSLYAK